MVELNQLSWQQQPVYGRTKPVYGRTKPSLQYK